MTLSILDLIQKGGILMYVLVGLSIVSLSLFIERLFKILKTKRIDDKIFNEIAELIKNNQLDQAVKLSSLQQSPVKNMIEKGLQALPLGFDVAKEMVENSASNIVRDLEKHLTTISTISNVAPLVGFLGTVTGMVRVFIRLQNAQAGVDVQLLAGGIWEALLTTVGGLVVGIMSMLFYNYLVNRIENITLHLEDKGNDLILKFRGNKK